MHFRELIFHNPSAVPGSRFSTSSRRSGELLLVVPAPVWGVASRRPRTVPGGRFSPSPHRSGNRFFVTPAPFRGVISYSLRERMYSILDVFYSVSLDSDPFICALRGCRRRGDWLFLCRRPIRWLIPKWPVPLWLQREDWPFICRQCDIIGA